MNQDSEENSVLRSRVEYLEKNRRYILDALEMALSIGDFQNEIKRKATAVEIFQEAEKRLSRLMNFKVLAFYLMSQEDSDISLTFLTPENARGRIEKEMDFMIEKGIVAWGIREKRGVIVPSEELSEQVMLHVIATNWRIRGIFVGILNPEKDAIPDISVQLFSIILRNAANALENIELFETIQSERILKKSKEYAETILRSIPAGIMIINADTHSIMEVNPQARALLGLSSEEVVGSKCHNYFTSCEKDNCPAKDTEALTYHKETYLITKDGEQIPILKTAVQTIVGEQKCLIASFVDIREQKKAEALRTEHDKLKASIEIAGTICHEMNQPLMVVSGFSELMMSAAGDEDRIRDYLGKVKEQVARMGDITRKLQSISKYATKLYLNGEIVDLDQAVDKKGSGREGTVKKENLFIDNKRKKNGKIKDI